MIKVADNTEVMEIVESCRTDLAVYCKTLFPDVYELPFSDNHYEVFDALMHKEARGGKNRLAIAAHRHFGKSTIAGSYCSHQILFNERDYIVPISYSATHSVSQTETLKRDLVANPIIRKLFGDVKGGQWAKDMWITSTGTFVLPRGSGQQVRGALQDHRRPDLIVVDDLEDRREVMSEEIRAKTEDWFYTDVINAIDMIKGDTLIVYIFNMIHPSCLGAKLADDPSWHYINIDLCTDDLRSNWPEFMDDAAIRAKYEEYKKLNKLQLFYNEFRSLSVATEDLVFHPKFFRYYNEKDVNLSVNTTNFVIVDPAKTAKLASADSAIVGIAIKNDASAIFIRDVVAGKFHPDQLYDETFAMVERLKARVLAVEITGIEEFISYPFRNEMFSRGLNLEFIELDARGGTMAKGKEARIAGLAPLYRSGKIWHNEETCVPLEVQLMSFPFAKRWDIMDATAYIVQLLSLGARYLSMPYKSLRSGKELEDEYASLLSDQANMPKARFRGYC